MTASAAEKDAPVYVADTHTFYWYLQNPKRLSPAADAVFRLAEAGGAQIVVPAIVIAELYYVAKKHAHGFAIARLLDDIHATANYLFSPLGREQLEELDELPEITKMHDRLIAAEARVRQAIVITKDAVLTGCPSITTLW